MKQFVLAAVAILAITAASGTVTAASPDNPLNATATPEDAEQIDGGLALVSSSYDADTGQLSLTFRATEPTAVTLVDAGGFRDGGALARRTLVIEEGEMTVEMPVTQQGNFVGVTITTDEVSYAEPVKVGSSVISGPWSASDVRLGALSGALSVALVIIYRSYRHIQGHDVDPERVA